MAQIPLRKGAGELRHKLALQRETVTIDAMGGRTKTWTTYATVYGAITPQPFVVSEKEATVLFLLTIRYRADVEQSHRIVGDGKVLKILAMVEPEQRKRDLLLHCAEA